MSMAIGIDLGTTNSVGAFKFARLEVVTAADNAPPDRVLTRSAVSWSGGQAEVGEEALAQLKIHPERVVLSVKRLMGRGMGDPAVADYLKRFPDLAVEQPQEGTEQSLVVRTGGRTRAPEDISAEILRKVVRNATAWLAEAGRPQAHIDRAVITVPAYFNDKQREATRIAGLRAGFARIELLPEPTAAAISHAEDAGEAQTVLVYDFGGGTFDASLITSAERSFIESAKAGDMWLGGDDVDRALQDVVLESVARQEGIPAVLPLVDKLPEGVRSKFRADLRMAIEQAKIALSQWDRTMVRSQTPFLDEDGMQVFINVPLLRSDLEEAIRPLVDRTIAICQGMIGESGFPLEVIDRVLLVGGSSQIPYVQSRMREAFGDKVAVHPRPMTAVAEGAAILAAGLVEKVGTVSRDYFIRLEDQPRFNLIARNEVLPVRTSHTFVTADEGQRLIHLQFFNHDHVASVDEPIGDMWLGLDKPYPKGTPILTLLELDESCNVLQVTASLKNEPDVKVSRTFSRGGADETVFRELEQLLELVPEAPLTEFGRENALTHAVEAVRKANDIVQGARGEADQAALENARRALEELKDLVIEERLDATMHMETLLLALEIGAPYLDFAQKQRLEDLIEKLDRARTGGDMALCRKLNDEVMPLVQTLPAEVRLGLAAVGLGRDADSYADPSLVRDLSDQALAALRRKDASVAFDLLKKIESMPARAGGARSTGTAVSNGPGQSSGRGLRQG